MENQLLESLFSTLWSIFSITLTDVKTLMRLLREGRHVTRVSSAPRGRGMALSALSPVPQETLPTAETVDCKVWDQEFLPFQLVGLLALRTRRSWRAPAAMQVVKDIEFVLRNEGICEWIVAERPRLLADWLALLHFFEGLCAGDGPPRQRRDLPALAQAWTPACCAWARTSSTRATLGRTPSPSPSACTRSPACWWRAYRSAPAWLPPRAN